MNNDKGPQRYQKVSKIIMFAFMLRPGWVEIPLGAWHEEPEPEKM